MQATHSPKILALVEGDMERMFCNMNFGYVHVVEISNGSGWTVEAMSKQISSKFYTKNMNADFVIVWIDKEKQACGIEDYKAAILKSLVDRGADPAKVHICMPDKMTENIILADEDMVRQYFAIDDYQYAGDGTNGKSIMKELFKGKGENYKETYDGVRLLKKVRISRAARSSKSAAEFYEGLKLPCWWLSTEPAA